ncbi:MAG: type IV secretory system conjugative DNA transfer family protein [Ruminococcus sp.]|nr:type IV secretory system conjugative DNA transfer family protein [Ruminococcus sp.]
MTDKKRIQYKSSSILAKDTFISNDTWETGINNNVLVVGPSGTGKTRSYVKPNIMQAKTNMIVSDAKGTLYRENVRFECHRLCARGTSRGGAYTRIRQPRHCRDRHQAL